MRVLRCVCAVACVLAAVGCSSSGDTQTAAAPAPVGAAGLGAADSLGWALYRSDQVAAGRIPKATEVAAHPDQR